MTSEDGGTLLSVECKKLQAIERVFVTRFISQLKGESALSDSQVYMADLCFEEKGKQYNSVKPVINL